LFTRLAVAEAEVQALKDTLADLLDALAKVKANQDELRRDHDEWRSWADSVSTRPRKSWRRKVKAPFSMSDPEWLISHIEKALSPNGPGLVFRILVVVCVGLLFWQAVLAVGRL
jgi:hypothetical protein